MSQGHTEPSQRAETYAPDAGAPTATAEPPAPPAAPPATSTATPPPRRRGCGCLLWVAVLALALTCGATAYYWFKTRVRTVQVPANGVAASAYSSAMQKAGVKAPSQPSSPVDLGSVRYAGSHHFEATFTYAEVTALLQAFALDSGTHGYSVSVSALGPGDDGGLKLTGSVGSSGSTFSGWIEGPVVFRDGALSADGDFTASVGGLGVTGGQANQAGQTLVSYYNRYLQTAPGLHVVSAESSAEGIHAAGNAPDSISW